MRVLLPILFLLSIFHHARSDLSEGTKALFQGASGIAADTVFPEPSQAHLNQFEFDVPSRDDMAIHRLHLSIRNMTEKVRKTLGDPQRKAILERNNDGSIHQGMLKIFAEVQGDVFALSNAISEAKAEGIFKSLASLDNDSTEVLKWKDGEGEASLLLPDQYMTKAKQEESIGRDTLVDFAQSILNPQVDSTSLINAMERLHALSSVGPDDDGIYSRLRDLLTTE
ncbi:Putative LOC100679659, partial [Caligus rogercresseyi]